MDTEVEVARFTEVSEAEVAKGLLMANGIPCILSHDNVGGMEPQMNLGEGIRLMVPSNFAADAERLLKAVEDANTAAAEDGPDNE